MTNEPENKSRENVSGASEGQSKPKKKKPIMIFRPQNSRTGMVKAGQRPGTKARKPAAKPAVKPSDPSARSAAAKSSASAHEQASDAVAAAAAAAVREQSVKPHTAPAPAQQKAAAGQAGSGAAQKTPAQNISAPAQNTSTPPQNTSAPAQSAPAPQPNREKAPAPAAEKAGSAAAAAEGRSTGAAPEAKASDVKSAAKTPAAAEKPAQAPADSAEKTAARTGQKPSAAASASAPHGSSSAQRNTEQTGTASSRNRSAGTSSSYGRNGSGYGSGSRSGSRDSGSRSGYGSRDGQGSRSGSRDSGSRGEYGSRDGQGSGSRTYGRNDGNGSQARSGYGSRPGSGSGSGQGRSGFGTGAGRNGGHQAGSGRPGFGSGNGAGRNGGARSGGGEKPFEKEGRKNNDRGRKQGNRQDRTDKFDRLEQRSSLNNTHGKNRNNAHGKPAAAAAAAAPAEEKIRSITIPEKLTIKDLADKLKIAPAQIVKKLFLQGKMVTVNEDIDYATAEEIALDYDVLCEKEVKVNPIEELLREDEDPEDTLVPRPPVVCVMGHVDHGKTSLLDAIRHTHVIDREAGGITQHIGASVVNYNGQKITFLDTPGHEAFTAMRMRGANSTDIAILVVAADDGVMPQTIEAINHAKAAGIEIIVAINKIDKPGANVEKVKQELTEYGLVPEDWGGSTIFVPVSAKTHEGIDTLLEMILLTAEVLELKANPNRRARGLVIEAKLDKGKGPVATILIQKGTLHVGDPIAAGACHGKVRAMIDDKGKNVKEAGPSMPVEVQGFSGVPGAGEIMVSPETEKEARAFSETFITEGRERLIEDTKQKLSLDDLFSQIQAGSLKELNLIVKADVQGSVEAVKQSLLKLSNDEVVVKIIHSAVGAINESDVILASASDAIIIGFNVRPDAQAKATAEQEGVDIRLYKVIYDAIADVEAAMKGMLDPVYEEKIIGHAEVRQTFRASGVGTIAGSYVLDGVIQRGCSARITRDGKQIFDGQVVSLKRFKDDAKEVRAGYECGIVFDKFNDVAEGDQIEAYTMVEVPRT